MSKAVVASMIFLFFMLPTVFANGTAKASLFQVEAGESSSVRLGVNYISTHIHYEPYYLSDEELDRDFALFNKQGLVYVTLMVVWKYLEPQMGVYSDAAIDDLKRVCGFAAKYDLQVIIDFYTMMSNDSWTMPTWLSPHKFEAVFTNGTARQAWLNFLDHCAVRLGDVENIYSWHVMNEPARREWACDVSIDAYIQLWAEMRAVFKSHSDRPVSIRFAAQVFEDQNHFNMDPRIYDVCDYLALNWYEEHCPVENLTRIVLEAREHTEVMISEFGSDAANDSVQADDCRSYLDMFRSLGLKDCIAWMWRADYISPNPEPPGTGYNLAKNLKGTPRPAFQLLDGVPPSIVLQSPANKTYTTKTVCLNYTINEPASWVGYSLDGQAAVTINGNTSITGLAEGPHTLSISAQDAIGNSNSTSVSFYVSKVSTFISCFVSKSSIEEGDSINIYGTLSPAVSDKTVTLTYAKPDGSMLSRNTYTGSDGSYSETYTPDSTGSWTVSASWNGDSSYNGTASGMNSFSVIQASSSGGIPGYTLESIVIGVIAGAIIIYILKRRNLSLNVLSKMAITE